MYAGICGFKDDYDYDLIVLLKCFFFSILQISVGVDQIPQMPLNPFCTTLKVSLKMNK